jgi:hypothetical protein
VSPEEFKEVVNGFMKFLDELNNSNLNKILSTFFVTILIVGKRKPKRSRKNKAQDKAKLSESVDNDKISKKIKYNPDFKKLQPQNGISKLFTIKRVLKKIQNKILEQHNNDSNQIKEGLSTNSGSVTIITPGNNESTAAKIKKGVNGPKNKVKEAMDLEAGKLRACFDFLILCIKLEGSKQIS